MGNTPPTLDYAAAKPRPRMRWTRRILLAVLVLACLYATPIAWLYWGWRQEQPAREMLERVGTRWTVELAGPAFLDKLIPTRIGPVRERISGVFLRSGSDDDLPALACLKSLKRVSFTNSYPVDCFESTSRVMWRASPARFTDAGLAHFAGATKLESLSLDLMDVTDAGLARLNRLTRLRELSLAGTAITDAGLAHLKSHPELEVLSLCDTHISDAGLVHLEGLTRLRVLDLSSTRITDAGVMHLRKLTGLRELHLAYTGTHAAVPELRQALPGCKISP